MAGIVGYGIARPRPVPCDVTVILAPDDSRAGFIEDGSGKAAVGLAVRRWRTKQKARHASTAKRNLFLMVHSPHAETGGFHASQQNQNAIRTIYLCKRVFKS